MDAPRDLYLTAQGQLCEAGTDEAAFLFHRKGQTITPQEDTSYGVTAYLERTSREGERAERQRILAEAKAVEQATVEDKAVAGPRHETGEAPPPAAPPPVESSGEELLPPEPRRPAPTGRRGA